MSAQWNRRSTIATFAVLVAIVILFTAFFVSPGILLPGCRDYSGPTESINGRTHCYATVGLDWYPHDSANYTEWGFIFHLVAHPTPLFGLLMINVTEPSGTAYSGYLTVGGPPWDPAIPSTWFTPDNQSGVNVVYDSGNASLLVLR